MAPDPRQFRKRKHPSFRRVVHWFVRSALQDARAWLARRNGGSRSPALVGERGEKAAMRYLMKQGYDVVARNWRGGGGELDLIMVDRDEVVFVEVKTRSVTSRSDDYIFDTLTPRKQDAVRRTAREFLDERYRAEQPAHRIDIVGVILDPETFRAVHIDHGRGVL